MKRGPKAPRTARRAPQPSAGARRKGAERPELLVVIYNALQYCKVHDTFVIYNTFRNSTENIVKYTIVR